MQLNIEDRISKSGERAGLGFASNLLELDFLILLAHSQNWGGWYLEIWNAH